MGSYIAPPNFMSEFNALQGRMHKLEQFVLQREMPRFESLSSSADIGPSNSNQTVVTASFEVRQSARLLVMVSALFTAVNVGSGLIWAKLLRDGLLLENFALGQYACHIDSANDASATVVGIGGRELTPAQYSLSYMATTGANVTFEGVNGDGSLVYMVVS